MWQPHSNPTIAEPETAQTVPSRHTIARQAYLDNKRSHAASAGKRFRWTWRFGFAG